MNAGRLLNRRELAEWLGVPESWVRDAITARRIPITWIGRHARFSEQDCADIVAAGHQPAINAADPGRPGPVTSSRVVPLAPRHRRRSA